MTTERSPHDEAFRHAFLRSAAGDEAAHAELEHLAATGATTAAFTDDELGPANFATAVSDFLSTSDEHHAGVFLRAAELVMRRGTAHLTNRAYVGNGGAPAVELVLEALAAASATVSPELVRQLLATLVIHGARLRDAFWTSFAFGVRVPHSRQEAWLAAQRTVVELAEASGAFTFDEAVADLAEVVSSAESLVRWLLRAPRYDVLRWLADGAARSAGVRRLLASSEHAAALEPLLHPFLSSNAARRLLQELAARHELLRTWLLRPSVLFALVRKKERRTLVFLLRVAPQALLAARDAAGHTLLHAVVQVHGRTEGIATLLLDAGFELSTPTPDGRTALDLARTPRLVEHLLRWRPRR